MILKIVLPAIVVILIIGLGAAFFNEPATTNETSLVPSKTQDKSKTPVSAVEEVNEPAVSSNETLDLSGQNLNQVPTDTFSQTGIKELNLANNNLEGALPAEVRFLQNLQVLNLSNNQFTGVPAEVGQLQKLEVLNLANNNLTGLPQELGNLSSLKLLDLRGNDYAKSDLEIIKQSLPKDVVIKVD